MPLALGVLMSNTGAHALLVCSTTKYDGLASLGQLWIIVG